MKRNIRQLLGIILFIPLTSLLSAQNNNAKDPRKLVAGISAGYNRGIGISANITPFSLSGDLPFSLRFGAGYSFLNPGNAAEARRIFINNNTNGTPEKKGTSLDLRLDFLINKPLFGISTSSLVFGPRFSTFRGNFKYVGGNEDFDVTSYQFGLGAGFENYFKMNPKMNLVLSWGLDIYAPSRLSGHDTSYSPDNDNINPRANNRNNDILFRYGDANRAIKQPFIMPRIMLGVNFGL